MLHDSKCTSFIPWPGANGVVTCIFVQPKQLYSGMHAPLIFVYTPFNAHQTITHIYKDIILMCRVHTIICEYTWQYMHLQRVASLVPRLCTWPGNEAKGSRDGESSQLQTSHSALKIR